MNNDIKNNSLNIEGKEVKPNMDNVIQADEIFKKLNAINVNEFVKKKKDLNYLSWAQAWKEIQKFYPDAAYEVLKFEGLPYVYDEKTGYICYTRVTIKGITREMWLPVMNYMHKAMKAVPYEIRGSYGKKTVVEAATMTDINNTIMRCLTKNLAMFGLGLYLYLGEDLPESDDPADSSPVSANVTVPNSEPRPTVSNPVQQPTQTVAPNPMQHPTQQKQVAPKSNWVSVKSFD